MSSIENPNTGKEILVYAKNGSSMCAPVNRNGGLLFLRASEGAGFSSLNPAYTGDGAAVARYRRANGQVDSCPASRVLPLATVEQALWFFRTHGFPPPFVTWHNHANDGASIPQGAS